ncbi:hypothetical protein Trydic_g10320 [Trypoxylus dichotomus]
MPAKAVTPIIEIIAGVSAFLRCTTAPPRRYSRTNHVETFTVNWSVCSDSRWKFTAEAITIKTRSELFCSQGLPFNMQSLHGSRFFTIIPKLTTSIQAVYYICTTWSLVKQKACTA